MIRTLGPRLKALHVNDNRGKGDDHLCPYMGLNDWDSILKALAEVDYKGDLTFEVLRLYDFKAPEEMLVTSAEYLYKLGQYMVSEFDSFKGGLA